MTGATLTHKMSFAENEKDVENLYREWFSNKFKDIIFSSPFGCDGFGVSEKNKIRVLCEFKEDLDLQNRFSQCKVLAQAIYYIKKFELFGEKLPSTVWIADRNEWFVVHTNDLFNYLSMDYDWSIAPNKAHTNSELMSELMKDESIRPFVGKTEHIEYSIDKIKDLSLGIKRLIPITPHNISNVFEYFERNVINSKELTTNQSANLFVQLLVNPIDNYLHPHKTRKKIVTKSFGEVGVQSREKFESFFSHFSNTYTPKQKEVLTSILDRLIEDVTRRRQGEFFTPTIWVDKAHEYITSVFGEDWREKYVVWDPAWGTGNLTRDYKFKELYCSTLHQSDIDTANQMGYNPEAVKFQFDFLNDPYEKLPESLIKAIESGKEIIVLMNPPYATANNMNKIEGDHKAGVANTNLGVQMKYNKWGASSRNIYAQFFYGICELKKRNKKIKIAVFCKPNYLTGSDYDIFRKKFLSFFSFLNGFLFQASHFSEVSSQWGITFSIFSDVANNIKNNFLHDLLDLDENFQIYKSGEKIIYNLDSTIEASEWVRITNKGKRNISTIQLKSALNPGFSNENKITENAISYILVKSNNVSSNTNNVALLSSATSNRGGISIDHDNFLKSCSLFTSRKTIKGDWVNDKDEYLAPNEQHPDYQQYTYDSVVYSLFNNSSQQSSLRQVTYKDRLWDVKNEFFWMSKNEMLELAETNMYDNLYNDARTSEDRYVHKLLFGEERIYDRLSPDAKDVLDTATDLVRRSIQQRKLMSEGFPEYHLDSWDAGYAQLKLVWKEYFPNEFKQFRDKYKSLEDRMRPLVYELGFLLK